MAEKAAILNDSFTHDFVGWSAAQAESEPAWLGELRTAAFKRFTEMGFPAKRDENYRFTDLTPIAEGTFTAGDPGGAELTKDDLEPYMYGLPDAIRLVFVDGRFRSDLSNMTTKPAGLTVVPFSHATETHTEILRRHLGQIADYQNDPFVALNTAYMHVGVLIHLAKAATVETPVHLLFLNTKGSTPKAAYVRNLFVAEEGSIGTVIESHCSLGEGAGNYTNVVLEAALGPRAYVDHYRLQLEDESALGTTEMSSVQDRNSVFRSHTITFGGRMTRNDYYAKLEGEASEAIINGLYMLRGKQHVDNWMWAEHCQVNIPSHELFKGILDDQSSAVFTGRIYVHPEAQKTDAKQTNQNLLLSPTARVNTKPQLEIYADDVKCTHGATIGQMDEASLFYLKSRGIPAGKARNMLVQAFAGDITDRIKIDPLREKVEELMMDRLPH
ncbi:MAG: Fe-S cluster assembly protein SufD [Sumerlaeia bacterium]